MIHLNFAQAETPIAGKNRYKAVPLTIDLHFVEHGPLVTFEAAVNIVQSDSGKSRSGPVVDAGSGSPAQLVRSVLAPGGYEVITFG
jgi:hypothetical protein